MSRDGFASRYGIHANTLARYEQGERTPDLTFLRELAADYHASWDWLMDDESGATRDKPNRVAAPPDYVMIPLVQARLAAGAGSLETDATPTAQYAFRAEWAHSRGQPDRMVLMSVAGASMEPDICDGDMVLVDQSQTDVLVGRIYAVGIGDAVVIKSLDVLPGKLLLRSANAQYPPVEIDMRGDLADDVRIIGRVIWWCREAR